MDWQKWGEESRAWNDSGILEWSIATWTNFGVDIADGGVIQISAQFSLQYFSQETRHRAAQRWASGIGRQPEVGATSRNRATNRGYDECYCRGICTNTHPSTTTASFVWTSKFKKRNNRVYLSLLSLIVWDYAYVLSPFISFPSFLNYHLFLSLFNRFSLSFCPLCQVIMIMLKLSKIFGSSCHIICMEFPICDVISFFDSSI